jgi:hypothetical protein
MYDRMGRTAVRFAVVYLRRRYRRELRIAVVAGAALIAVGAYLASRNVPEG